MEDIEGADNATVAQKNPYTGTQIQIIWPGGSNDVRGPFLASLKAGRWKEAGKTYRELVDGLDRWVAFVNREKYKTPDPDKPETQRAAVGERLTGLRRELRALEGKNPTRVAAVLHMDEYFENMGDVQEVPLSLYYWKEGSNWYVKDLTTPDEAPALGRPRARGRDRARRAPVRRARRDRSLPQGLHPLDAAERQGRPRAHRGPSKIKKWAGYIGMAAAAIGLGLVTFGTGTVAVAGGYILAGSAVLGAATAGYDLTRRASTGRSGPPTRSSTSPRSSRRRSGSRPLRFGRILANVRTAAAAGAAVEATDAIQLAQQRVRPRAHDRRRGRHGDACGDERGAREATSSASTAPTCRRRAQAGARAAVHAVRVHRRPDRAVGQGPAAGDGRPRPGHQHRALRRQGVRDPAGPVHAGRHDQREHAEARRRARRGGDEGAPRHHGQGRRQAGRGAAPRSRRCGSRERARRSPSMPRAR